MRNAKRDDTAPKLLESSWSSLATLSQIPQKRRHLTACSVARGVIINHANPCAPWLIRPARPQG